MPNRKTYRSDLPWLALPGFWSAIGVIFGIIEFIKRTGVFGFLGVAFMLAPLMFVAGYYFVVTSRADRAGRRSGSPDQRLAFNHREMLYPLTVHLDE